jgi:hypothetical protein
LPVFEITLQCSRLFKLKNALFIHNTKFTNRKKGAKKPLYI